MSSKREAIEELWLSTFGDVPSVGVGDDILIEFLVRYLPPAPPYGEPIRARGGTVPAEPEPEQSLTGRVAA